MALQSILVTDKICESIPKIESNFIYLDGKFSAYQLLSQKAAANGYASLDATGKVPIAQIPSSGIGDVLSVFGRTGAVVAANGDYTTSQVTEGTNLYFTNSRARTAIESATYSDPSWITSLNWSKIIDTPTSTVGYGITDAVLNTGSYTNPGWISSLHWNKISNTPTTLAGYGIADAQPLDADLTSLAGASLTGTIYYRSAPGVWSNVVIGANLSFSGGTLSSTGGGMAIGGSITGATQGSVLFAGTSGVLAQNNDSFNWNDTNKSLKIISGGLAQALVLESTAAAYYSPKFRLVSNPGGFYGDMALEYGGDFFISAQTGNYIGFGIIGVLPNVQINSYPYALNASPNNFVQRINVPVASGVGLMVRGASSQTGDLVQLLSSSNVVLAKVASDGASTFASVTAAGNSRVGGWFFAGNVSYTSGSQNIGAGSSDDIVLNPIARIHASGSIDAISTLANFSPASGTGVFNQLSIKGTINQQGGANGITRGLYVNPTLTSAADFRAIETVVGNVILGSTSGNVGIGALVPGNKLEITHGTAGNSGLRFTNLTSSSSAGASSGKVLSVNNSGDVVLETSGGGSTFNIDSSVTTGSTYGAISGAINGSNTVFTVSNSAYTTGTLKVFLNGQLQTQGTGYDWTETSPAAGTFTFAVAPSTGDIITVEYQQ